MAWLLAAVAAETTARQLALVAQLSPQAAFQQASTDAHLASLAAAERARLLLLAASAATAASNQASLVHFALSAAAVTFEQAASLHKPDRSDHQRKDEDGILDVLAWSTMHGEFLVDVSVRHPGSVRYAPKAWKEDGHANDLAEKEKQLRYPPTGGKKVIAGAVETWGRCGPELLALLTSLASFAQARDISRGLPPQRYMRKWRLYLTSGICSAISRAFDDSLVTDAGRPAHL